MFMSIKFYVRFNFVWFAKLSTHCVCVNFNFAWYAKLSSHRLSPNKVESSFGFNFDWWMFQLCSKKQNLFWNDPKPLLKRSYLNCTEHSTCSPWPLPPFDAAIGVQLIVCTCICFCKCARVGCQMLHWVRRLTDQLAAVPLWLSRLPFVIANMASLGSLWFGPGFARHRHRMMIMAMVVMAIMMALLLMMAMAMCMEGCVCAIDR